VNRYARFAGYAAIGAATALLVVTLAVTLLTRTGWGMEQARRFAAAWLERRIEGDLHIGRITGPGLLRGAIIHDFGISDLHGRPFFRADSMELAYHWRSLLAGRIIIDRAILYQPRLDIELLPGDTLWNYERIFLPAAPAEPVEPVERGLIVLNDVRVVDGVAAVRTPWVPGDTARLILEAVPGGLARTLRFEAVGARLGRVIWESPIEPGQLVDVQSLQALGYVWRDPIHLRDARGTVTVRDSIVSFDFPVAVLPDSEAGVLGRVVMRTGGNDTDLDIRVDGRRVAFRDLHWLYPRLPDEGGGTFVLRVQSQPDGTLWLAEHARLEAPGTAVAGSFGIVTGDTLYFTQVDLRASPLDIRTLEQILPGGLPVEGLLVGTVEVRGPLSALETSGDVRLAGATPGAASELSWRGVLDVRDVRNPRPLSLRADIGHLELELLSALEPAVRLPGSISGRVEGIGRRAGLDVRARLEYVAPGGGRSVLEGGGTVQGTGRNRSVDLTVSAAPVAFRDLAAAVPALDGLYGELSGPVRVTGTAADLTFDARLGTAGGAVRIEGRWQGGGGGAAPRITATVAATDFRLHALRPDLPELVATGVLTADMAGTDPAHATGTLHALLDSARIAGIPLGRVAAGIGVSDGVLTIDSASILTAAGIGRARGTVGLVEGRTGELEGSFISESITPFEEVMFGARARPDADPRLAGRVDIDATATGWIGELDIAGRARGESIVYGRTAAARVHAELTGRTGAAGGYRLVVAADSVTGLVHPLEQAALVAVRAADSTTAVLTAMAGGEELLRARGTVRDVAPAGLNVRVDEVRLGGRSPWRLAAPVTVAAAGGIIRVDRAELARAAGGRLTAGGQLAWVQDADVATPMDFSIGLSGMPFTEFLRLVRSSAPGGGELEAALRVTGTALDPLIDGELSARDLLYGDVRIDRAYAEISYAGLGIDMRAEAQYGGRSILTAGGRVPIDLRFTTLDERRRADPLRVTITADSLPAALPIGLLDGFSHLAGRIDGTIALSGTSLDPSLSGGFTLRDGSADWDVSGVRYHDVNGEFSLERDRLLTIDVRARAADPRARPVRARTGGSAGGHGTVTGQLDFTTLADPAFDLRFTANRAYAAKRRDVDASVTGEVRLEGRYSRPEVSGALRVDQGVLDVDELYRQYLIVGLEPDDPGLLSLVDTSLVAVRPLLAASANPFLRNLQVRNLQLAVGPESWVRSSDMDVEVSGNLNISLDRRDEDMRLTGALDIERGMYTLYYPPFQSRRFQVREGTIEFPGTPGIDPGMSITAAYRARANNEPLDILAVVSGTLQNPRVRLTSSAQPPISESDLASYLFFGVPTWEVANTGAGGTDVRAMAGLGFRALGPSVLGYASSGLQALVQSAGLLDYVSLTAAEGSGADRAAPGLTSFLAGTQLEIGRYLGPELFVGYSQRLGSIRYDPAVRIEWRFLPEFSLEMFAEDRFARMPGFGLRSEPGLRRVYGFALFREWGF
jgi:autotransporter translocation and assembly factor TamB